LRYQRQTLEHSGKWVSDNVYENTVEGVFERLWAKRHVRYVDKETGEVLDRDNLRISLDEYRDFTMKGST